MINLNQKIFIRTEAKVNSSNWYSKSSCESQFRLQLSYIMKLKTTRLKLRLLNSCLTACVASTYLLVLMIESSNAEFNIESRQTRSQRQELFLEVLSGKDVQPASDISINGVPGETGEVPIDQNKVAEINRLVDKLDVFENTKPRHLEAFQKCVDLLQEQPHWRYIMTRASKLRDQINIELWINAVVGTTIYSPAMAGLYKPALIELSPDRYLSYAVIERAINQSGSVQQRQGGTCTMLDETTGAGNGIENSLWYFREDIQVNAQHWYWHIAYPNGNSQTPEPDRRGELFYFFHQSMLARYNAERLSNNLPLTTPLRAATANEVVEEGYITYLRDINSGFNYGTRQANQQINYSPILPFLTSIRTGIDGNTFRRADGQTIPLRNTQGINLIGNAVESSSYSVNGRLYGNRNGDVHNTGHGLIADLAPRGVMGHTATSMRDIVFYRWHTFVNDIFERHKSLLPEYSLTEGDAPLAWAGVQVTNIQINPGLATATNNLRTFWSQRKFDISRGLDLRRASLNMPVRVCVKHLNHDPFSYTINIVKQTAGSQRASIRIYLAPRNNLAGTRFSMDEQRKLLFILDSFSATLSQGNNVIQRDSSASTVTKPWSKTFQELENPSITTPQCGCGWPEHLLIPKGRPNGMVYDLFVYVTNGLEDSTGNLDDQPGTCTQPYHYCGIRGKNYPDRKPMGFPFDRRPPLLPSGRPVANLDEFVRVVPNSGTVQVTITHLNQLI